MNAETNRELLRGLQSGELVLGTPPGSSEVWKTFNIIINAITKVKEGKGAVQCSRCKKILSYGPQGTTSTLKRHLDVCTRALSPSPVGRGRGGPSRPLTDYMPLCPSPAKLHKAKEAVIKGCVALCCKDMRPFEITNGRGFRELAQTLVRVGAEYGNVDTNLLLPAPQTISRRILTTVEDDRKILIPYIRDLIKKGLVAATTDMWTDNYKKIAYTTLTVAYITDNWELKSRVIFTNNFPYDERKTAENVLAELKKGFTQIDLNESLLSKLTFVTDQGRNIIKALSLGKLKRLNCCAHLLNTILANTFKPAFIEKSAPAVAATLKQCKDLVGSLKHSGLTSSLKETVIQQVETRWNSRLTMMLSVYKQFKDIYKLLEDRFELEKIEDLDPKLMHALIVFLTPFKEASDQLESEKTVTISYVIPWYLKLQKHLEVLKDDIPIIVTLKREAEKHFKTKFEIDTLFKLGTFFAPQFKKLKMFKQNEIDDIHNEVRRLIQLEEADLDRDLELLEPDFEPLPEVLDLSGAGSEEEDQDVVIAASQASSSHSVLTQPSTSGLSQTKKKFKPSFTEYFSDDEDSEPEKDELAKYLDLKYRAPIDGEESTLLWWKQNGKDFPNLAKVARKILCIPASSATSERNFSSAGYVVQERRSRLRPHLVDAILFVHNNEPIDDADDDDLLVAELPEKDY